MPYLGAHRFEYGRDKTFVKIGSPGRIRTSHRVEENKVRGYCLWQEWALGVLALDEKLRDNPVSGLAWSKLCTWRR
jgi:hypothetical protein